MFLYELAMELDLRSIDLAADAVRLGLGDVGPTTDLKPEQVAALRAACGHGATPAPSSPTFAPPPPAGPVPPPFPAPPGTVAMPTAPPAGAPAPPPFPPNPPAPFAGTQTPPTPGPVPVPPGARSWRQARGQMAVIGAVVALVAALFVYMAANSGPDPEREAQLHAENRRAEAEPPATLAPTTTSETPPLDITVVPGPIEDPQFQFVDLARFCTGARGMTAYELRISAGAVEGDWQDVRRALIDGRPDWRRATDDLAAGASLYLAADIGRYRTAYEELIDGTQAAASDEAIQRVFVDGYSFALRRSAKKINSAIESNCRAG